MNSQALALVLIGSVLHVLWNVMTKASKDNFAFLWWAIFGSGLLGIAIHFPQHWNFGEGYYYLIATILIHSFYFWILTKAYLFADLSFVYPYCRGVGTLVATIGGITILKEYPSTKGFIGITLTLMATILEPLLSRNKSLSGKAIFFTILTGISIAWYLLNDKVGLRYFPVGTYLGLMLLGSAIVLFPVVYRRLIPEICHSTYKPFIGTTFLFGAYFLILKAMAIAPISYIVAARASGIAISGVLGVTIFKEKVSRSRWIAISMIIIGVYLLGTANK